MKTPQNEPATARKIFISWNWTPIFVGLAALGGLLASSRFPASGDAIGKGALLCIGGVLIYFLVQTIARLIQKQWRSALFAFLRLIGLTTAFTITMGLLLVDSFFGPSEDHFADALTIPEGIEIAEPVRDPSGKWSDSEIQGTDSMQAAVKAALAIPGGRDSTFVAALPSLRRVATENPEAFREFIEASPDWHVFIEQGHRFAARRWSYGGEPRNELHGYISEFGSDSGFQTRVLLCLDQKQWSSYQVQHIREGSNTFTPDMSDGNGMHESRVIIECGAVWVEIFEQSKALERRATKASIATLESEFSEFLRDPSAAVAVAKKQSRDLALRSADTTGQPFQLLEGSQPGIYGISYTLNPGESGVVYLKAIEVTQGTRLSEDRLRSASETRMTWSLDPAERFGAKAAFTIYEGDWGKPYAARFEVWFKPDTGRSERKLAERNYKIEGWQR